MKIQPSTGIVAERFRLLEQKPISNAVDATNYCTLAIGQPTHVFDLDKLEGGIVVRRARKGEKLRTSGRQSSAPSTPTTSSSPTRKEPTASPASWAAGTR